MKYTGQPGQYSVMNHHELLCVNNRFRRQNMEKGRRKSKKKTINQSWRDRAKTKCFLFFWNGTELLGTGKLLEQLRDCLLPALDSSRRASSVSSSSQKSTSEMDEDRETKLVVETGWPASSDRRFRRVSDAPLAPLRGFIFAYT